MCKSCYVSKKCGTRRPEAGAHAVGARLPHSYAVCVTFLGERATECVTFGRIVCGSCYALASAYAERATLSLVRVTRQRDTLPND